MGEIKSTLDIALEKAKAIKISPEDRKHFKQKEILSKTRDIFQQYIDHPNRSEGLTKAIKDSGKDAPLIKESLTEAFLAALDPSHPSGRVWEGLHELGLKEIQPFQEKLAQIAQKNEKAQTEERKKVETVLLESLSGSGITGTAIDPNVDETPQWKQTLAALDQKTASELGRLRDEIVRAIKSRSSSAR
jgi:hypothetical protein